MSKITSRRENSKILSIFCSKTVCFLGGRKIPDWSWGRNEVELVLKRSFSVGTQQKYISKNLPGEFPDSFKPLHVKYLNINTGLDILV